MQTNPVQKLVFVALTFAVLAVTAVFYFTPTPSKTDLEVFAASSFAWMLNENRDLVKRETGLDIRIIEANSATLAQQIAKGAPADVFISADRAWLNYLADKNISLNNVWEIARNSLGLAFDAEAFTRFCHINFVAKPDAVALLDTCPYAGRVATGDPAFVPLGKYAAETIEHYQWDLALAPAANARAAIILFEEGATDAGIFYVTDIKLSQKALTWFEIPEESHSPIVYWAVLLKDSNGDATESFLNFLKSKTFRTILENKGFHTTDMK